MTDQISQSTDQPESSATGRLVPVGESIKYRRRAQQAEGKITELEQQLKEFQTRLDLAGEQFGAAEAQRDEARTQLIVTENRMSAERMFAQAGVVDIETASILLGRRVDLSEALDTQTLTRHIEQLLLDKPFLQNHGGASLPPRTSSPRPPRTSGIAELTDAARKAAQSGDRRDVANYLRLRRASDRRI